MSQTNLDLRLGACESYVSDWYVQTDCVSDGVMSVLLSRDDTCANGFGSQTVYLRPNTCSIMDLMGETVYIQSEWTGTCDTSTFTIPENCEFLDYTGIALALQAGIDLKDAVNLCHVPNGRW